MATDNLYCGGIVEDGYFRARAAIDPKIREQVLAEFAEQLREANWFQQLLLSWKINAEVRRRADQQAPPFALY